MVEGNGDLVKYTVKELLMEIREAVANLDKRIDTLEKDMQEGKETVKTMLLPDYHGFKASMQLFERETQARLDKVDRAMELDRQFHENNVPVFKELVKKMAELEQDKLAKKAVDRFKKTVLALAFPALYGAVEVGLKIFESTR